MYEYKTTIKLHHTDAAGTIFFAKALELAHDVYESFLNEIGEGLGTLLTTGDYMRYIVYTEADFKSKVFVGDEVEAQMKTGEIGTSSFSLGYAFFNKGSGELIFTAKTVHVVVDKVTQKKCPIPDKLRARLEEIDA